MSALDTDCTSGTGKIHAFTLNFTEIGSRLRSLYTSAVCHARTAPIFTIFNRICHTRCATGIVLVAVKLTCNYVLLRLRFAFFLFIFPMYVMTLKYFQKLGIFLKDLQI